MCKNENSIKSQSDEDGWILKIVGQCLECYYKISKWMYWSISLKSKKQRNLQFNAS